MKNRLYLISVLGLILISNIGCKSEFEKLRATGDAETLHTKAFYYYENGDYVKAQMLFELIINNLRGKVQAEKVYFYYANTHYYLQKYILASYYYKNFANTFPNSEYREEADFMSAYSNYELSPKYRLDQTYTEKAIDEFQLFANYYPNSTRVQQCNLLIDQMRQKLEKKAVAEAELYYNLKQYQSALHTFENVLKDYPDTKEAEKIRYLAIKASFLLAQNSVYEKQAERYEATLKKSHAFISRYPNSPHIKEVRTINDNSNNKIKFILP
jgi:outer membrane protein assembly factor BamD